MMPIMDLRIMTEPQQGASYATQLTLAKAAESLGFSGYFRSDHYLPTSGDRAPSPTDAWVTLAGLARETSTIRLGTLTTEATFRLPGVLGVQVAQVDQMSDGRVELGLGAGSHEAEHRAYGIPFPPDRNARLEEQLQILHTLWRVPADSTHSFNGTYYQLAGCPALPKPVQAEIPVIISGVDVPRAAVLAADYAHEFNAPLASVAEATAQFDQVRSVAHYREDLVYSATVTTCIGKDDAEVARRAAAIGREVAELKAGGLAGTPAEAVDTLARYAETGATRIYLQILDMSDLDHLDLIASDVRTQLT
jgi:alkanesulfonate monooxygenase SsuD/methylene tetrahydromethanopterin reductase-like flavin-dependent oxidoreductase (luciferase family)